MPRYFLHLIDEDERVADTTGTDFRDLTEARANAEKEARRLAQACLEVGDPIQSSFFHIADEHGTVLSIVPVSSAIN